MKKLYEDSRRSPEERARALLEELSLDEKMAQVAGIFPFGESYNDMEKCGEFRRWMRLPPGREMCRKP